MVGSVLELSHKAELLVRILYKEYLGRRESGIIKSESFAIGDTDYIHDNLAVGLSHTAVDEASDELRNYNLVFKNLYGYIALSNDFLDFCEKNLIK